MVHANRPPSTSITFTCTATLQLPDTLHINTDADISAINIFIKLCLPSLSSVLAASSCLSETYITLSQPFLSQQRLECPSIQAKSLVDKEFEDRPVHLRLSAASRRPHLCLRLTLNKPGNNPYSCVMHATLPIDAIDTLNNCLLCHDYICAHLGHSVYDQNLATIFLLGNARKTRHSEYCLFRILEDSWAPAQVGVEYVMLQFSMDVLFSETDPVVLA